MGRNWLVHHITLNTEISFAEKKHLILSFSKSEQFLFKLQSKGVSFDLNAVHLNINFNQTSQLYKIYECTSYRRFLWEVKMVFLFQIEPHIQDCCRLFHMN